LSGEIDEEIQSHIEEAIAQGRDPLAGPGDRRVYGAFRLIDALLLRPLPVALPERLYVLARQGINPGGNFFVSESSEYPWFRLMRAAVKDQAELIAISYADHADLLAGVGLYGVLDYSVLQRRREIGIRMAIGAQSGSIARLVTMDIFTMVLLGSLAGAALGMALVPYIATLLYRVKPTDLAMLALPSFTMLAAVLLAAMPAVFRAVRIDPAATLRAE
jgi:hypothetical protein